MIEIYTQIENGVDFVIDRLQRGSIINFRSFLLRDKIAVFGRCMTPVSLYYLTLDKFYEIRSRNPYFHYDIKELEDVMVDMENPIALDYILSMKTDKSF
jgi:CRP-like cAMP-binding protein